MKNLKKLALVGMTVAMVLGSTVSAFAANIYTVTGTRNFLALRSEKCYDAGNIIGKLHNGDTVDVVDASGQYWTVTTNSGKTGYVDGRYLTKGQTPAVDNRYVVKGTKNYLALRTAPKYDARNEIAKLHNGDIVNVISKSGTYWKVQCAGMTGYVDARFLAK